ncbi:co-chaperone GroES [Iocasia frigidifontis]|uniref:Co-chaperonin GroES n=1 Tax=Iocasia fonsfrigidae TaxID=2682810 RepID=A0A8A7KCQ1_9FIRM|nr:MULTISPECIES: co-chaperone GroES [Halanaerobiaceae]AZO96478.1 co-chaperone GroES [Halocella sp. SP3-1]MTI60502.1 co-chaperone GroES [Bacillota bacterium]QTL99221.1 co-chaperone GroES [Iocasia fonsfrigidae]
MAIKPLNDRVVVQYVEEEEKTKSGIVLPDTAKGEKPQQGEVIAVGKGCEDCDIKTGDQVVFDKYAGTKVNIDDVEYIIIKVDDVLAVIE